MQRILSFAVTIALTLGACASLERIERGHLFPAPPVPAVSPELDRATRQTWLDVDGDRIEAFLLLPEDGDDPVALMVYAHGNGELVDSWLPEFAPLRATGLAILLIEYPGYGRSSGQPSEKSIQHALAAGYDWALSDPRIDARRIVGFGHSLGGGAVCALARVRPLAALILESTFSSARDMAAERFDVPGFLIRNPFDNVEVVRAYPSPLLILHGEKDSSIPVAHAHRLAAAAPAAELEILDCSHSDCPRAWEKVTVFLRKHRLL